MGASGAGLTPADAVAASCRKGRSGASRPCCRHPRSGVTPGGYLLPRGLAAAASRAGIAPRPRHPRRYGIERILRPRPPRFVTGSVVVDEALVEPPCVCEQLQA